MSLRFSKHYNADEVNALLPQIRDWLSKINGFREELARCEVRLEALRSGHQDLGGETANRQVKLFAEVRELLGEFQRREIQIKDFERGLMDFPALIGGKEVFLCWEQSEDSVGHWHTLESGYAGRQHL